MTQGDIHNRTRTVQRLEKQIQEIPQISERDKLLTEGNTGFPSFLTYMQNNDHSNSWTIRCLRTAKRIAKYTSWNYEDVSKARITEHWKSYIHFGGTTQQRTFLLQQLLPV